MNIRGMHHVAIICSNYEASKYFYVNVLGCKVIRESYRSERDSYKLDLMIPNMEIQIELFSFPSPPPRPSYPEAVGLRHLAFRTDDLDLAVSTLRKFQVQVEPIRTDPFTGQKFTFFADPDGLPLELYEESGFS